MLTDSAAVRRSLEHNRIDTMEDWDGLDGAGIDHLLRSLEDGAVKDRDFRIVKGCVFFCRFMLFYLSFYAAFVR